jgi:23S rRNA (cytosine1962-C5)-methyltransferase
MTNERVQPAGHGSLDDYELLDFGGGRKLERFGPYRIDRPCPSAEWLSSGSAALWRQATARYDRTAATSGIWTPPDALPTEWPIRLAGFEFLLRPNAFGHLGIFPEHWACWSWVEARVAAGLAGTQRPVRVLNLFAYTGGSTLAAAKAGAEVTHVDAARNMVLRAKDNLLRTGIAGASIRWIAEDARRFVDREVRRGSRYEGMIIDPPTYGHGVRGERWKLDRDLPPLLAKCATLCSDRIAFALLTCHTPGWGPTRLSRLLACMLPHLSTDEVACGELQIGTAIGRSLPAGSFARWPP